MGKQMSFRREIVIVLVNLTKKQHFSQYIQTRRVYISTNRRENNTDKKQTNANTQIIPPQKNINKRE